MAFRHMTEESSGGLSILLAEYFIAFIIGGIITFYYMYTHDESIICNTYYCYAHKHSWVCYVGWISFNGYMASVIYNVLLLITGFPIFHNIKTFFHNYRCSWHNHESKPKQKKSKNDLTLAFLNYRGKDV